MAGVPYNKRPFDLFVSYSHGDGSFVESLVNWLQVTAGLRVWWDSNRLVAGDPLVAALPAGIQSSRAALFCVSSGWCTSTWCEHEFGAALQEQRLDRRYRIIAIHLDDSEMPPFLANARYVQMSKLDFVSATTLINALVPEPAPWPNSDRDIYLSRSWHANESTMANTVSIALSKSFGFRLIGDSPDYTVFDGKDRIRHIIESCGGLVAVLPYRDDESNGYTSKWIVREAEIAHEIGLPFMLFGDARVQLDFQMVKAAVGSSIYEVKNSPSDALLLKALALFEDEFAPSTKPSFSFFATSISKDKSATERLVDLMEQVTSMECLLGQRMRSQHAQKEIVERIRAAQFVLADITENNLNSFIEAGVARGAGTPLYLISKYPTSGDLRTRFMFRDMEVNWYQNDVERIGVVHRIARLYRRKVYNPND